MEVNYNNLKYSSCRTLHRLYADDQLELERQLERHRRAAAIHNFQYCEDPTKKDYSVLHERLIRLNRANFKKLQRELMN
jgi:hypothetical protein